MIMTLEENEFVIELYNILDRIQYFHKIFDVFYF